MRFFAYLDPGTGSQLLQILAGGLIGLLVAVKAFWGQIKNFLRNITKKS